MQPHRDPEADNQYPRFSQIRRLCVCGLIDPEKALSLIAKNLQACRHLGEQAGIEPEAQSVARRSDADP